MCQKPVEKAAVKIQPQNQNTSVETIGKNQLYFKYFALWKLQKVIISFQNYLNQIFQNPNFNEN